MKMVLPSLVFHLALSKSVWDLDSLGLFLFVVTNYLNKYPGAVVADPYMEPDPREVHVHAHH